MHTYSQVFNVFLSPHFSCCWSRQKTITLNNSLNKRLALSKSEAQPSPCASPPIFFLPLVPRRRSQTQAPARCGVASSSGSRPIRHTVLPPLTYTRHTPILLYLLSSGTHSRCDVISKLHSEFTRRNYTCRQCGHPSLRPFAFSHSTPRLLRSRTIMNDACCVGS